MMLETIRNWMREGDPMPVCKLVGMTVEAVENGWCRASLEVGSQHWTPFGTTHGGILCDLSDLAMGMAFMTTLLEGEGLATIELKINYFRPVMWPELQGTGPAFVGGTKGRRDEGTKW